MEKKFLSLKTNKFEYIKVTGLPDQFGDLKRFCGNDITITYETCPIDDYWCITLQNSLTNKKEVVPNGDYIIKIPGGFTIVDSIDVKELFIDSEEATLDELAAPKETTFTYCDLRNIEGD